MLSHNDSSIAPQTVRTALPVCGTKNFVSVRLYSEPQFCIEQSRPWGWHHPDDEK